MADQHSSTAPSFKRVLEAHRPSLDAYEELYKHFHSHPELSLQEAETAKLIAERLRQLSPELDVRTGIGGHGLIAIFNNGPGKTALLRADMDALPVTEKTGLPYASNKTMKDNDGVVKSVMHATAETLLAARDSWSGTVIFLFQPAEERAQGADAMVKDGLYEPSKHNCPKPDVVLGQHVAAMPAGTVGTRFGTMLSAADSFKVTIYGRGGHGSMPHRCIDPVVIASHIVVRLQTVVSREVPPDQTAVVTVGSLQAGHTENIIADEAVLKINIRNMNKDVRKTVLAAVERIIRTECQAAKCPKEPLIEPTSRFPLTVNDAKTNEAISRSFAAYFGDRHIKDIPAMLASEDFGILGTAIDRPYCFWLWGGHEAEEYRRMKDEGKESEIPINHSPFFAPVIQPTLTTGVDAMVVAALTFLGKEN